MSNELIVYDDEQVERTVLAYHILDAKFFHALSPDLFSFAVPRKAQKVLNAFYQEWGQAPKLDALENYAGADTEVILFLTEVSTLRISDSGYRPAVQTLYDMYLRRQIMDSAKTMVDNIGERKSESDILRDTIDGLSALKHPLSVGEIERAETADVSSPVWIEYTKRKKNPELYNDGIRYGIYELDNLTNGGTRKGHITLVYGDTSSGKTRLKINMAYNMAMMGKRVMYVTIEDSLKTIVSMWLSRASLLELNKIQKASLSNEEGEIFRNICIKVNKERTMPYVVYWTGIATSADLRREIDLYINKFQHPPDVVFFDYSNEAYPVRPFNNTSERFNYLFSEYRQLTAQYQIPLVTSLQESRTGKQKKKEEEYGLDSIGQSHYVAPHCHVVVYIKQRGENDLDLYVQKNRYGQRNKKICLFALWPVSFIGDRGRLIKHEDMSEVLRINAPPVAPAETAAEGSSADLTIDVDNPVNAPGSSAEDAEADAGIGMGVLNEEDFSAPES